MVETSGLVLFTGLFRALVAAGGHRLIRLAVDGIVFAGCEFGVLKRADSDAPLSAGQHCTDYTVDLWRARTTLGSDARIGSIQQMRVAAP